MSSRPAQNHKPRSPSGPLACVFAEEEDSAQALREFFESFSCEVIHAKPNSRTCTYSVISGSPQYVKTIASDFRTNRKTILCITWKATEKEIGEILSVADSKVVLLPDRLSFVRHKEAIFRFYFTDSRSFLAMAPYSQASVVSKSSGKHAVTLRPISKPHKVVSPKEKEREIVRSDFQDADKKRIRQVMAEMYTPSDTKTTRKQKIRLHPVRIRLFLVIALIAAWFAGTACAMVGFFFLSVGEMRKGNVSASKTLYTLTRLSYNQTSFGFSAFMAPLKFFHLGQAVGPYESLFSAFGNILDAQMQGYAVIDEVQAAATLLLQPVVVGSSGQNSGNPAYIIQKVQTELPFVTDRIQLALAQIEQLEKNQSFPFRLQTVQGFIVHAESTLSSVLEYLDIGQTLLTIYTHTGGFDREKRILVLFQNSMELRPTGGFIGSVANVSMLDGRLRNLDIQDVYVYDGQLKGHVDPPEPIRTLLGQEHWYLRDSNWNPDFGKSGATAIWFFEKESGEEVDASIAVNTPFIVELLKATGPIELTDYNDTITSENFYGKALHYVEKDFFPGSTQKKSYLDTLHKAMLQKIFAGDGTVSPSFLTAVVSAVRSKNILFYAKDRNVTESVAYHNMTGSMQHLSACSLLSKGLPCHSYVMMPVEANMSVSKVNYFVKEQRTYDLTLKEGMPAQIAFTSTYANQADNVPKNGGDYTAYLRLYTSGNMRMGNTVLDGKPVAGKIADSAGGFPLPYRELVDEEYPFVGMAFRVPMKKQSAVTMTYAGADPFEFLRGVSTVNFSLLKQPGLDAVPHIVRIRYPLSWTITDVETGGISDAVAKPGTLEYNTVVNNDIHIKIEFRK